MKTPPDRSNLIAPEGVPILALFAIIAAALGAGAVVWLGVWGWIVAAAGAVLTLWCAWFFRDPARVTPQETTAVVSPADGVVCLIETGSPPKDLGLSGAAVENMVKVCVFMNVFNVHVNRAPVAGVVHKIAYHTGQFLNASFDKASELNERSSMALRMADGRIVVAVQIAGLVARRIVSRVREGRTLAAGERYGLIRFGSRVDVYMPAGSAVVVTKGQKVVAGETVLGRLNPVAIAEPGSATASAGSPSIERRETVRT